MRQLREEHGIEVVLDLNDKKSEAKVAQRSGLKYVGKKTPFIPTPSALEGLSKTIDHDFASSGVCEEKSSTVPNPPCSNSKGSPLPDVS